MSGLVLVASSQTENLSIFVLSSDGPSFIPQIFPLHYDNLRELYKIITLLLHASWKTQLSLHYRIYSSSLQKFKTNFGDPFLIAMYFRY